MDPESYFDNRNGTARVLEWLVEAKKRIEDTLEEIVDTLENSNVEKLGED